MKKFILTLIILMLSGPVFAADWINLQSNVTYSDSQLLKRYDAHIRSKFPLVIERTMNRRAMGQSKGKYTPSASDTAQEKAYETHCNSVRVDLEQAKLDNALLKGAIRYERAEQRLSRYILSKGAVAVKPLEEVTDTETGEITQEAVPGIIGIDSLPATVKQDIRDADTGEVIGAQEIPNPLVMTDVAERESAQQTIDTASAEIKALVEARE